MNTSLLAKLMSGPLFGLLTAGTYRAALWVLGGTPTAGHIGWGLFLSGLAALAAWAHASLPPPITMDELELRDAAEQALDALQDPDTAWTPAGTDARQALRSALGQPTLSVCEECKVDQGGHSQGCTKSPRYVRSATQKGGEA